MFSKLRALNLSQFYIDSEKRSVTQLIPKQRVAGDTGRPGLAFVLAPHSLASQRLPGCSGRRRRAFNSPACGMAMLHFQDAKLLLK
jgi:hypothetical protein